MHLNVSSWSSARPEQRIPLPALVARADEFPHTGFGVPVPQDYQSSFVAVLPRSHNHRNHKYCVLVLSGHSFSLSCRLNPSCEEDRSGAAPVGAVHWRGSRVFLAHGGWDVCSPRGKFTLPARSSNHLPGGVGRRSGPDGALATHTNLYLRPSNI